MFISVKLLTKSDLSFFRYHLKLSKQKAINLNAGVFIEKFYPGLRNLTSPIPLELSIIGPAAADALTLTRKAIRSRGSKNWRLNGEFIYDPENDPSRFHLLVPGDFAILGFEGEPLPLSLRLALVSKEQDSALHLAINDLCVLDGKLQSMRVLEQPEILNLIAETESYYSKSHPLASFDLDHDTLEDLLYPATDGSKKRHSQNGLGPELSAQELAKRLANANETGAQGEEYFNLWLQQSNIHDFDWVSEKYSRAAYDFFVRDPSWTKEATFVDVKSTQGAFERTIHMSFAEVRWAAQHTNYAIARVFDLNLENPNILLLSGISELAQSLLTNWENCSPTGINIDSISIDPSVLTVVEV